MNCARDRTASVILGAILFVFISVLSSCNDQTLNQRSLFDAAGTGDLDRVKHLIAEGMDPDTVNENGETPLIEAIWGGFTDVSVYLINSGGDVNRTTQNGIGPIHIAAWEGHADILKLLIQSGVPSDKQDRSGWTPLHYAVNEQKTAIVEHLFNNPELLNIRDTNGWTPLFLAARNGDLDTSRLLVEKGADINARNPDNQASLLHLAAYYGDTCSQAVEILCMLGADLDSRSQDHWTPLHVAAFRGFPEICTYLVNTGADVHATCKGGKTALHLAAEQANRDTYDHLIRLGSDSIRVDETGKTPGEYLPVVPKKRIQTSVQKNRDRSVNQGEE